MSMFAVNRPMQWGLDKQPLKGGRSIHEMSNPSSMMSRYEDQDNMDFAASQMNRKVKAIDQFLALPGMSRFGRADTMQERSKYQLLQEAYADSAQRQRERANIESMMMEPFQAQTDESTRARALGYENAADMRERAAGRTQQTSIANLLMQGIGSAFAPFASQGGVDIGKLLLGGLLDTDITMRDNALNPIAGVMAQYRRPANNTYGAS